MNGNDEGQCVAQPTDLCLEDAGNCQARNIDNAALSSGATRTADDFTPASSGNVNKVCWWGAYVGCSGPDDFQVTYYNQGLDGLPGTQIAQFRQSALTLTVTGPAASGDTIAGALVGLGWVGTHANVAVAAGQCYWIEIVNLGVLGTCGWFWQDGEPTNGRLAQDGGTGYDLFTGNQAFCLNIALGDASTCVREVGGCCLPNGLCIEVFEDDCTTAGGTYQGDGSECADVSCPLPACCFLDGSCQLLTDPDCAAAGGASQGAGSSCVPNDCIQPDPCIDVLNGDANCDGSVNNFDIDYFVVGIVEGPTGASPPDVPPTAPAGYLGLGGTEDCWAKRRCWGDVNCDGVFNNFDIDPFVDCVVNTPAPGEPCPLCVAQACELPGGSCQDVLPASCFLLGGVIYPDVLCNNVKRACCFPNGNCSNLTPTTCTARGGRPQELGQNCASLPGGCPPPRACCFPNGACTYVAPEFCTGRPLPLGSNCDPNPCPQPRACCFPDGTCQMLLQPECLQAVGNPQAEGSTCTPNPCPQPEACCAPDGSCSMIAAWNCAGLSLGAGSDCDPNPCPPVAGCCLDSGQCVNWSAWACVRAGGVQLPGGALCFAHDCLPARACCYGEGNATCDMTQGFECAALGGVYMAHGSTCTPNPCPP
ncbi:MAG: hypothetical protein IPM64_00770 [Phycisphaerales bacterium]|nr:hypothetical protein [Phycisphaerales bacterium]